MKRSENPIGVYDSGVGGLAVLQVLRKKLPHEDFIYFADTANLPYGTKTPEQIIEFTHSIIQYFAQKRSVKMIVSACNTSSGIALDIITPEVSVPVIGTMLPTVKAIMARTEHSRLGVIATPASAANRTHEKMLRHHQFAGEIVSIGCPEFVPLIEAGSLDHPDLLRAARKYLQPFHDQQLNTLIYGCTHYTLIHDLITILLPAGVLTVDPAAFIAAEAYNSLYDHGLLKKSEMVGTVQFECSGNHDEFKAKVARLMPS